MIITYATINDIEKAISALAERISPEEGFRYDMGVTLGKGYIFMLTNIALIFYQLHYFDFLLLHSLRIYTSK